MSGTMPDPAAGANPFGELAKFALAATERNTALARNWSDTLLTTLKEQSDEARSALATLTAALEAMERTLTSQEETNRAMRESLDAYRQIIDRYAAMHERTARLVQTAVDDLKAAGEGQMEAAKAMLLPPAAATAAHRAVHTDDAGVDRRLQSLRRRRSRIPDRPDLRWTAPGPRRNRYPMGFSRRHGGLGPAGHLVGAWCGSTAAHGAHSSIRLTAGWKRYICPCSASMARA